MCRQLHSSSGWVCQRRMPSSRSLFSSTGWLPTPTALADTALGYAFQSASKKKHHHSPGSGCNFHPLLLRLFYKKPQKVAFLLVCLVCSHAMLNRSISLREGGNCVEFRKESSLLPRICTAGAVFLGAERLSPIAGAARGHPYCLGVFSLTIAELPHGPFDCQVCLKVTVDKFVRWVCACASELHHHHHPRTTLLEPVNHASAV